MGRRRPLEPVHNEGDVYECAHKAIWPPIEVIAYQEELIDPLPPGVPIAEAFRGVLSDLVYQRVRTWEQVCGLREMSADKCLSCPHVVKNEGPRSGDGDVTRHLQQARHPGAVTRPRPALFPVNRRGDL